MSTETSEESKLISQIEQERGNTPVTDSSELEKETEYDVIEYYEDGGKFTIKKAKFKDTEKNVFNEEDDFFYFFRQYDVNKKGEPIGETISISKTQINQANLNELSKYYKNTHLLPLDAAILRGKIALFKYPTPTPTPKKGFWRGGKKKSSYKKGCRKTKTAKRCRKNKTAKRCRKTKPILCRK